VVTRSLTWCERTPGRLYVHVANKNTLQKPRVHVSHVRVLVDAIMTLYRFAHSVWPSEEDNFSECLAPN